MFDAWLGAALLLLLVLGIVRCVVAWLIYKNWQQQRDQQMEALPQNASMQLKRDKHVPQRSHHLAQRPRPRERHTAHWVSQHHDR